VEAAQYLLVPEEALTLQVMVFAALLIVLNLLTEVAMDDELSVS
jgi:hypothetical protein